MDTLSLEQQCYEQLPPIMRSKPWEYVDHGRKILETQDELNAYIASYGEMHIIKCKAALQNFPFEDLQGYTFEVFDWGCGQGLATLVFLEMLISRGFSAGLKRITLIEPSPHALNRAKSWIRSCVSQDVEMTSLQMSIPNNDSTTVSEIHCSSQISINLFSNILDIRSLSLSWLAKKTANLAAINYMICVGPKFGKGNNTRIDDYCGYFDSANYFSRISCFPYAYTSRTRHAYGCDARCFVHKKGELLNLEYKENAEEFEIPDPYECSVGMLDDIVDSKTQKFYCDLLQSKGSSYDVFFRPFINCDTVDFLVLGINKGIILINVCENLDHIKEDFQRIKAIKQNLFNIHLRSIKIDSIINTSVFNCVKTALYFPNNSEEEIRLKISTIEVEEQEEYNYLLIFTASSNVKAKLDQISAPYFKYEYYDELEKIISSNWHSYKDGDQDFKLTDKQKFIAKEINPKIRYRGVAGSGKTQIVAYRAVHEHIRTGSRVLIITFNISLIQYIRMRINQVPADFSPNMFEVINYHQFFKSKANQYAKRIVLDDFDKPYFFAPYRDKIQKYKSIIIDEAQDFKEPWFQSIIHYFLDKDGRILVMGDGDQNIYSRKYDEQTKMPSMKSCEFFGGVWPKIGDQISMRIQNPNIALLASRFASTFLDNNQDIAIQPQLQFGQSDYVKYWNVGDTKAEILTSNIRWILAEYQVNVRDVVVLGQSIRLLRDIEAEYVKATNEQTMMTFETADQYLQIKQRSEGNPVFFNKDLTEIRRIAKTHFTTSCDCIKLSTVHSFKGWEAKTIILLLQPEQPSDESFEEYSISNQENVPALIYTALTRAKNNLFVLNLGNQKYHSFFIQNIQ